MAANDPPLDYAPADPTLRRRRWMMRFVAVAGCLLLLIAAMRAMWLPKVRSESYPMRCQSRLRQIGQAIALYQQDFRMLPPNLNAVLMTQTITADLFVCPASSDVWAAARTSVGAPGTCSYIYVGASLRTLDRPNVVLALEDPANHAMEGGNIVFADGHVEWVDMPYLIQILGDLEHGLNPPSATATLTPGQARQFYNTQWRPLMPRLKAGVWHIPTTAPATAPLQPE